MAEMIKEKLREAVRAALYETVEEEMAQLCGPRHHPAKESKHQRAGSAPSVVYFDGRKVSLKRPRVRQHREGGGSEEVSLESWKAAQDPGEWEDAIMRATLYGVSTRDVEKTTEQSRGSCSRSTVSRRWAEHASRLVREMQEGDLSGFDLLVLMVDGVVLAPDQVVTVALGVDVGGNKKVLGYQVGASENQQVCMNLLENLQTRGLKVPENRALLAVLDGSKALRGAITKFFAKVFVQRCLIHKERNMKAYVGKKRWKELCGFFSELRHSTGVEAARGALEALNRFAKGCNAQAAECLAEGSEDLLTLFEIGAPSILQTSLLSTNGIENVFKNLRRHLGRVCRWREDTQQANRWMASGLTLAQRGLRRLKGREVLPGLAGALERACDTKQTASA
jgi:transposase-like protein